MRKRMRKMVAEEDEEEVKRLKKEISLEEEAL
jgi:hypothetical protein